MDLVRKERFISPEEYLEGERTAPFRSEYISGEVFAMASAGKRHGRIVVNVGSALLIGLKGGPCEPSSGLSVAAPASFLVPDLVVCCNG